MFKSILLALAVFCGAITATSAVAQADHEIKLRPVPEKDVRVIPGSMSSPDAIGIDCGSLRGEGFIFVVIDGTAFLVKVDCSDQKTKRT